METIKQPFLVRNFQGETFFVCLKRQFQENQKLCSLQKIDSTITKNPSLYKEVIIKGSRDNALPLVALKSDLFDLPQNNLLSNQDGSFDVWVGEKWRKVQLVRDFAHSKGVTVAAVTHQKARGKLGYRFIQLDGLGLPNTFVLCEFARYELKVKKSRLTFLTN